MNSNLAPLSVVFYTANKLEAARPHFAKAVRDQIVRSVGGDFEVVCVSHEPLAFGDKQVVVGPIERGHLQIYRNVLRGALSCSSDFVALCEDDAMYSESHFRTHRPEPDTFAYNINKWGINTWVNPPVFGYRARRVINHLIAPRQLLIDSLEERFAKYPDDEALAKDFPDNPLGWWGDLGRYEKKLGVTPRKSETFAAPEPGLVFNHEEAFGFLNLGTKKSVGKARRDYLWPWGSATTMLNLWNGRPSAGMSESLCTVCGKPLVKESDFRGAFPLAGVITSWMCADEEDDTHQAAYARG